MSGKSHVNTGTRKVLEIPKLYNFFQDLIGGNRHRKEHFEKYINSKKPKSVLDIGCGTAILLKYLDNDIEYVGCDMQESYINFIKKKYSGRGEFYCEKVGEVIREDWLEKFDIINAHGLLHHLDDKSSHDLLAISKKYLKKGGFLLTVDSVHHLDQSRITKYIVSKDRGQNIRTPTAYLNLAKNYFDKVEGILDDKAFNIPFSIYTMIMYK